MQAVSVGHRTLRPTAGYKDANENGAREANNQLIFSIRNPQSKI